MNLLPAMILYLAVGCGEWYLALRRTLACARGEKAVLVSIVFIENLLGLWVLSNFIRTNNWLLALSYSTGAAAGALIMVMDRKEQSEEVEGETVPGPARRLRALLQAIIPAILAQAGRLWAWRPRWPLRRLCRYLERPH